MTQPKIRSFSMPCLLAAVLAVCAAPSVRPVHAQNATLKPVDRTFLTENAQGSLYDYATAEAAANLAQSDAVRDYAVKLLEDHNRLNKDILTLARAKHLALPLTLQKSDERKLRELTRNRGAAFDRAYLKEAVKINTDDVRQARKEAGITTDPDVKSFVFNFQQTEEKHLADARDLLAKMK